MYGRGKLAESVAAEIEQEIISLGWPVGRVLGSEADLIQRYGVSRAVLREAIRLLEHHLVAEMRRGRNGGLVVLEPDPSVIADAVALFLRYRGVQQHDLFEVRRALELTSVRLAAERASEEDVGRLRAAALLRESAPAATLASEFSTFHELIAEASGNPAVHLFVQVISMLTEALVDHAPAAPVSEGIQQAHVAIAEAIAAGDSALAQRRLLRHFDAAAQVGFR